MSARTRLPAALALCLAAAACTSPAGHDAPAPPATATATAIDAAGLGRYHWRLADARDRHGQPLEHLLARPQQPVQLDFSADRISLANTCNRMSASYRLEGAWLQLGPLASTLMACTDPALAALDQALAQRLDGRLQLELVAGPAPQLVLATPGGDRLAFAGEPTAATRYGGQPERVFLEVAARTVPCHHPLMGEQACLQVRQVHYDGSGAESRPRGEWQVFHDPIEGYVHRPGVRNVLRLDRYTRQDPPADASRHAWVLDLVVESEQVAP